MKSLFKGTVPVFAWMCNAYDSLLHVMLTSVIAIFI